jgi:hypothetical protein
MSEKQQMQSSENLSELEREIREGRKFSLEEAIARLAGPGAMKGESPVARMQQAQFEIDAWLGSHLGRGPLQVVLQRYVAGSDLLLNNFEQPLVVLAGYCHRLLDSEFMLQELVRETDFEWGREMGERPFFERAGTAPHPDDPYTIDSVRKTLIHLLEKLSHEVVVP